MNQPDKIKAYLDKVCEQVRFRKAHNSIRNELNNHIIDQRDEYIQNDIDEEKATSKAIKQMGDPINIGTELDISYRPKIQWSIIIITSLIIIFGFILRYIVTKDIGYTHNFELRNSIISIILGIGLMTLMLYIDFTAIGKYSKAIYIILVLLTIFIHFSKFIFRIWMYIPALMILFPVIFSGIIYTLRNKGYAGIIISVISLVIPIIYLLIITLKGYSGILIAEIAFMSLSCFIILTTAVLNKWFNKKRYIGLLIICISILLITAAATLLFKHPYLTRKIPYMFDFVPHKSINSVIKIIIYRAKLIGTNSFPSIQEMYNHLYKTDYMVIYLISKYGWIAFIIYITIFTGFLIYAFRLSIKQKSVLAKLISQSILITYTVQIIRYTATNLGFPSFIKPGNLLFISYGNTAFVVNMILMGLLLSVFRTGEFTRDDKKLSTKNKFIQLSDDKIIINLRR